MSRSLDPASPLGAPFLSSVSETIDVFLTAQEPMLGDIGALPLLDVAREATSGGKRLRPAYCYWGHVAAAGLPDDDAPLLAVASSLDLLHVSALVHDDLIDAADTRRGLPAAHKRFEALHEGRSGRGDAGEFGVSSAILLGDLLLAWAAQLADSATSPTLERARPLLSAMRAEVMAGQYLDVAAQFGVAGAATVDDELEVAHRVLEYKSARYSIRRPTEIGAALGGADDRLLAALGEFGSLVGRAFQLRDDVLGVYGDEAVTGKSAGGDIREGKRTVLVLTALQSLTPHAAGELEGMLGAPDLGDDGVARAAALIESSGARDEVEAFIGNLTGRALDVLDATDMTADGRTALRELAARSVRRAH